MKLFGWLNPNQAAEEVWCSIHSSLLSGELLLGYKNTSNGDISRLVIVLNKDNSYGIGLITSGYTELLPSVPLEFLSILHEDLKAQKLDKKVLEDIKYIIENKRI